MQSHNQPCNSVWNNRGVETQNEDCQKLAPPDQSCVFIPRVQTLTHLLLRNVIPLKDLSPLTNLSNVLTHLDLRGCAEVDDTCSTSIGSLTLLKSLCLSETSVSDRVLFAVIGGCVHLEMLELASLKGDGVSMQSVERLTTRLTKLQKLKITASGGMTDIGFRLILGHLHHLELLDVSQCWLLTNQALDHPHAAVANCHLRAVGIYGCSVDRLKLERQIGAMLYRAASTAFQNDINNTTNNTTNIDAELRCGTVEGLLQCVRSASLKTTAGPDPQFRVYDNKPLTCIQTLL